METYWGKNGTRTRVIENILKPDGNRISAQVDYEYDNLYRLTHEHRIAYNGGNAGVAYEYNFVYDGAGNRTSWQVVGGPTTNYTYDAANKMTSPGTFTYDDKGNTSTIASGGITTTYTWDLLNRMTQWSKTGQTTQDYVYNADGMRVRKTPSGGTATNFLLDRREIAEEITGSTATAYVGPGLVSKISSTTRTIYHADGLGSTRAMTDSSQVVGEAGIYDAYGNLAQDYPSSSAPNFGYAGVYRYYADATYLDYVKARYYDPQTSRFLSRDPIGYYAGINLYNYVSNNPANDIDPTGLLCIRVSPCTNFTSSGPPQVSTVVPAIMPPWEGPPTGNPLTPSVVVWILFKQAFYGTATFYCFGIQWYIDPCNGKLNARFGWYDTMPCRYTKFWWEKGYSNVTY